MSLQKILSTVGEAVSRRATVESVVGQPIVVGKRTLLPIARIQYGFGGGDNAGIIGSGGGMEAVPLGLVEIGPDGVLFHAFPTAAAANAAAAAALTLEEVGPGISRVGESPGCFLLVNGKEGAIVNAPPNSALSTFLIQQPDIEIKYILLTACDYAHAGGLADMTRLFPKAEVVAHRSVAEFKEFPPKPVAGDREDWRAHMPTDGVKIHRTYDGDLWDGYLDGEVLFAVHAHESEQRVVFRGTMMTSAAPANEEASRRIDELFAGEYAIGAILAS